MTSNADIRIAKTLRSTQSPKKLPGEANRSPSVTATWQTEMKQAIRTAPDLLNRLQLPQSLLNDIDSAPQFPLFVPAPLLSRIKPGNVEDPILRQVLPLDIENDAVSGFDFDPLQENRDTENRDTHKQAELPNPVLRKYTGRALLVTTGVCGVHCRYCFRRHFPYQALPQDRKDWESWLAPIRSDDSINEVILSGGDPLVLTDPSLRRLTDGLKQIPHVRWLRVHSRMPVVIPARITRELIEALQGFTNTTVVLHINHANEIDDGVRDMVRLLNTAGLNLLNQSVLLRGVNDNVAALKNLSVSLVDAGIQPYYLHQLDRVQGAAHFEVSQTRGRELMQELRTQIPGHAMPQYAQEIPGQPYKSIIGYT